MRTEGRGVGHRTLCKPSDFDGLGVISENRNKRFPRWGTTTQAVFPHALSLRGTVLRIGNADDDGKHHSTPRMNLKHARQLR